MKPQFSLFFAHLRSPDPWSPNVFQVSGRNFGLRRARPALSIQIVNFLIEFVKALYCSLHFTEFPQKYPCKFQCKPFLKCQQTCIFPFFKFFPQNSVLLWRSLHWEFVYKKQFEMFTSGPFLISLYFAQVRFFKFSTIEKKLK